jgi:2-polyprenyl-3-methyl-5-hydroxy-6-metoxy-1,4-benzoquinol methylase
MQVQNFDQTKAEAFAGHMLNVINGGFLTLSVSIGRSTGLFETMNGMEPSSSSQIAAKAGLNERYVREWLGAMVTGKIVEFDPQKQNYFLAPEHSAFLVEASGMDNMPVFAETLFTTSETMDKVVECFRRGGGVKYDDFSRCLHCIKDMSVPYYDSLLIDKLIPLAPGLKEKLEKGISVLDVGCGHGHGINVMAAAFPKSTFTGYDIVEHSIKEAQEEAKAKDLKNTKFKVLDAAKLNEPEIYDLITTFDAVHDQAYPRKVLKAIFNALKKDGTYFMADIKASSKLEENMDHPLGPSFYTVSLTHCMTVSLAYGGEGLGTMWGKQTALEMLSEAGFKNTEVKEVPEDIMNYYYISSKK